MKVCFWNARGLVAPEKRRRLRSMIRDQNPWIIAICETHFESIDDSITRYIDGGHRRLWTFSPAVGQFGGILVGWAPAFISSVTCFSHRHFVCLTLRDALSGRIWHFSAVHMPCERQAKNDTRLALSSWFRAQDDHPWLLAGDFNATIALNERFQCFGDTVDSASFVDWIDLMLLTDIGYSGQPFTWSRGGRMARLDRFLATDNWKMLFLLLELSTLPFLGSDHRLIVVNSMSASTAALSVVVSTMKSVGSLNTISRLSSDLPGFVRHLTRMAFDRWPISFATSDLLASDGIEIGKGRTRKTAKRLKILL